MSTNTFWHIIQKVPAGSWQQILITETHSFCLTITTPSEQFINRPLFIAALFIILRRYLHNPAHFRTLFFGGDCTAFILKGWLNVFSCFPLVNRDYCFVFFLGFLSLMRTDCSFSSRHKHSDTSTITFTVTKLCALSLVQWCIMFLVSYCVRHRLFGLKWGRSLGFCQYIIKQTGYRNTFMEPSLYNNLHKKPKGWIVWCLWWLEDQSASSADSSFMKASSH